MSAAYDTTLEQPAEVRYCRPDRETLLSLRHQTLSRGQVRDARSILDSAIDELLAIDATRAADLITDLKSALGGAAQ